ncbi:MAG: HAMP domain-containing protein, partial [Clostridiales bacterium]|nr:HAMP domain-containing protein [Clostridiales bacterium]
MKRFKTKISFKKVNWKKLRFKWYKDYSILTKMLVGFLFVTLLAGTVGVFGMNIIERMNRSNNEMFNKLNAPMQYMTYLYEHYYKMRIATTKGVMSENADYIVYQMSTANTERDQVNAVLESLEGTWLEEDRPAVDKFKASLSDVYTKIDEILANVNNDRHEAAIETLNSIDTERAFTSVEQGLRTLISLKINKAKEQLAINEKGYTNDKSLMITILGISLLLSVLIGIYISFIISVPIKSLIKAANRLADGEVDVSVKANTRDEVGKLTEAFSRMINNIKEQAFAAEKIANGDLDIGVTPKSEKDVLSNSMLLVISTLKKLLSEIGYLINELKNENFAAASDVEPFFGAYREIISGVNSAVNAVREKMFWYEAMLDSIPFPVTVTDLGMNLTFVNKAGEEIMNSA